MKDSTRIPALRFLHHWPTRILCITLTLLQGASLNWLLMHHLGSTWAAMFVADAVVMAIFIASFHRAANVIHLDKGMKQPIFSYSIEHQPLTYVGWFVYATVLDIKMCVVFTTFSTHLDDGYFFGPNMCKTVLSMAGPVFISFLHTQHDVTDGERKSLIYSLTPTTLFDLLDSVEYMDTLFEKDIRDTFPAGLDVAMIVVCCINFLSPTIPLLTLSLTRFGSKQLPRKLLLVHKLCLAYLVNIPLFTTRMIKWHGLNKRISMFTLKNVVMMGVATCDAIEIWCTDFEKSRSSKVDNDKEVIVEPNDKRFDVSEV